MRVNPFYKFLSAEDLEHIRVVNYIKDKLPEVVAFHVPMDARSLRMKDIDIALWVI